MPSGVYKRTPETRRSIAAARRTTVTKANRARKNEKARAALDEGLEERRINVLHKTVAASCSLLATKEILDCVKNGHFELAAHWLEAKEAFNKVCDAE
tara:strand:- start:607 stop:900 length:294 start_codon:yes stop_codon:yes gene_type:complete